MPQFTSPSAARAQGVCRAVLPAELLQFLDIIHRLSPERCAGTAEKTAFRELVAGLL